MFTVKRSKHNPILSPDKSHPWEAAAVFNGCPSEVGKKKVLVYRAMSEPEKLKEPHIRMSVIGRAESTDGRNFSNREVLIGPETDFDRYGCEDPRVTKLGKDYYIFYTGLGGFPFGPDNIRICVAKSKDLKTITERHLVTPFNAKAMGLFPEKINGKYAAFLSIHSDLPPSDICYAEFEKEEDMWNESYWKEWHQKLDSHKLPVRRQDKDHVELGAPPIKTKAGWLVVYCHMQKYTTPDVVFGVEILLLDLNNPREIIGRTKGPIMVADSYYENAGLVGHLIFPSGAKINGENLEIYYGAADTHCAVAEINLENLLITLDPSAQDLIVRYVGNPILAPRPECGWEKNGVLNPAAIELNDKIHILYRAASDKNVSTIGYASTKDGFTIDERSTNPIYIARENFEKRSDADEWYGCEDPRIVKIGERLYMTYTAYDGYTPRVAVSSILEKDFLAKKWQKNMDVWSKPEVITPEGVANKDAAIIPESFGGKYVVLHRVGESVCAYVLNSLDFSREKIDSCIEMIAPRRGMWDNNKVGIAAPPIKTKKGWLLLYHGISWNSTYRVGVCLLDLKDPTIVLSRSALPIFEPKEEYEMKGVVGKVVFPCGIIVRKDKVFMYYGAADYVMGVATFKLSDILKTLE